MSSDYTLEQRIYFLFTTRSFATGIPTLLTGIPVVSAYEDNSTTSPIGVPLTVNHDNIAGLNLLDISAEAQFGYDSGKDYNLVITQGTVDGVPVVGEVVGRFSLERSAAFDTVEGGVNVDQLGGDNEALDNLSLDYDGFSGFARPLSSIGSVGEVSGNIVGNLMGNIQGSLLGSVSGNVVGSVGSVVGSAKQTGDNFAQIGIAGAGLTAINLPNQTMDITGSITSVTDGVDIASIRNDVLSAQNLTIDYNNIGYAKTNSTIGTVNTLTGHTPQTGDNFPRLGAPAGASVSADLVTINNFVNSLEGTLGVASDFGSGSPTIASNLRDLADNGTAIYNRATDSQQAIRDRGDAAWTTGAGESSPALLQNTTIATLASQTSFTLTAGSADDDAYRGSIVIVTDQSTPVQKAIALISGYAGSTKTITLAQDPGIFTMAIGDTVDVVAGTNASTLWDESLAGSVHNINNSAGRRLRELADAAVLRENTFQLGSTTTSLILDASASSTDEFFTHQSIVIVDGAAMGQARIITSYDGTTKAAGITPALVTTAPGSGDEFQILTSGPVHAATQDGGYENGQIFIDTLNGTPGTVSFENGTISRPVDSISDARIIADKINLPAFHFNPGTSVTLAQSFVNFEFLGAGFTVNLGGQDVSGTTFFNATITGTDTSTTAVTYINCQFKTAVTLTESLFTGCSIGTTITLSSTSDYMFDRCFDGTVNGTPIINFGSSVGDTHVTLAGYFGVIQVEAMGDTGTDTFHLTGTGRFIESACTGGTVNICGVIETQGVTNLNIISTSRLDVAQIGVGTWDRLTSISQDPNTFGSAVTDIKSVSDALGVSAATKLALSAAGIISGIAQSGTLSTTQATTSLTGFVDVELVGRTIIFTGGEADGQATDITAYVSANGLVTYTGITTAPADADPFVIV